MNGYLLTLLGVACGLVTAAIGDMVSEEIRDRLRPARGMYLPGSASKIVSGEL